MNGNALYKLRKANQLWFSGYVNYYQYVTSYMPYRQHIQRLVKLLNIKSDSMVLDLGCGAGDILLLCKQYSKHLYGIDNSPVMLQMAKRKINDNCSLLQRDLSKPLPYQDKMFDRIICNNVLAYLPDATVLIKQMLRVLKIGGIFILSTLKRNFNPLVIFKDQLKGVGVLWVIRHIIPTVMIGFYNRVITKNLKSGIYKGYDEASINELLSSCNSKVIEVGDSYVGQDVFVKGIRI